MISVTELWKLPRRAGIYVIVHGPSQSFYIGQSSNIRSRIERHLEDLNKGVHHNGPLSWLWTHSGEESFQVEVHSLAPSGLSALEKQRWLVQAERRAIQDVTGRGSIMNRAEPEIVENPAARAEFEELKRERDKAEHRATSAKRRVLKLEINRLREEIRPVVEQMASLREEIEQREKVLSRCRKWFAWISGVPSEVPIEQQESELNDLKSRLSGLTEQISASVKRLREFESGYKALYQEFPKVNRRLNDRMAAMAGFPPWLRKKTITEQGPDP